MSITSFYFLMFYLLVLILYYIVPRRIQWAVLLLASVSFFLLSGSAVLLLYPIGTAAVCFAAGNWIAGAAAPGAKRAGLCFALLGTAGVLFVLKYINFLIYTYNGITSFFYGHHTDAIHSIDAIHFLLPLGISFYTLTMLGYVIDLYYGIGKVSRNFLKFSLYALYFPVMVSGPILRFGQMEENLYQPHPLNYDQLTRGFQRMIWGFFKKLVISERMAIIVNQIYGDYTAYQGAYFWVAAVCFVLQLYTDFSGCMDIVLGLSQTFGIILPENFKTPFFSKSIAEFWRRWHMTLGAWMKDYVFYPLLRSAIFTKSGKVLREKLGKKRGKQITTFTAMFLLWFTVGIWHGGEWKYVLGSGLIHWCYIVLGELTQPVFKKWFEKLGCNYEHPIVNGLRSIRVFLLVSLAFVFFRAESVPAGAAILKSMFTVWNPAVIFGGTLFTLGLDWVEFVIAVVSLLILLIVSLTQERYGSVRDKIAGMKLPVRWLIWYALLFYTILLGYYGPGYSAAEFIYQGF